MIKLDNEIINPNDVVYDIVNGSGSVVDLGINTITVLFKNKRRLTFTEGGKYNGQRRLFWHNPIFVAPPKDPNSWGSTKAAVVGALAYLESKR